MASVDIIEEAAAAQALADEWDELARACGLPMCAPGWSLSWWRHVAPARARLRLLAAREGGELVALAPWFVQRGEGGRVDVRFLGAEMSDRVDVLCRAGAEKRVAPALREAILSARPRPDLVAFEAVPHASRWTRLLGGGAQGRLRLARYRNSAHPAPSVALGCGSAQEWLQGRSANFRSQMRRMRRRLGEREGTVRRIDDEAERDRYLEAMLALHAGRWEGRGESNLARAGVPALLGEAARALGPDRMRLWAVDVAGEPVSVQVFIAAGAEVKYWNGGWSETHGDLKPSMLTILAAVEEGIERGERRLDLGVGEQPYKLRFADGADTLTWGGLIVRNRRWPRTSAELAPRVARYRAKRLVRAMPEPIARRAQALAGRGAD